MTKSLVLTAAAMLAAATATAGERGRITGAPVGASAATVFAGGCTTNGEANAAVRQVVLAWRITSGSWQGVALDGLTVLAAVAGEGDAGMGGEQPGRVRAVVRVDARATPAQAAALVAVARELSRGLITEVVRVEMAPVRFATTQAFIEVSAGDDGRQQFQPLSTVTDATAGGAEEHACAGAPPDAGGLASYPG